MIPTARAHLRSLWPRGAFWPIAPFVAYAIYSLLRSELRTDHVAMVAIASVLAYSAPRTKELLLGTYPLGLVFILYDGMRPFQRVGLTESRVHLCGLRALDSRLFGKDGSTVHDYFYVHHTAVLDLLCAIPYATFIFWCVGGALYLYVKDRRAMKRFAWGFFVLNVAGFITYHLLPAAPPWYFHAHGCVVDLATRATEGPALARVDELLGVSYFHNMYSKASSVFGALPSLHCAYPLLLIIEGWRAFGPRLRAVAVAYFGAMVFSAVYLDHHWILDCLLGVTFAVVTSFGLERIGSLSRKKTGRESTVAGWTFATWFGCGLSPIAPGTVGSLGALPLYFAVRRGGPLAILVTALVVTAVGIWAANVVVRTSGEKDPQRIVIDEVAGVLLTLAFAPQTAVGIATGFVLFRLFDITKPFPVRRAERLAGGWGVVVDDLAAGAWAVGALFLLRAFGVMRE